MTALKSYKETINYLFQKLPMYQRDGASAYKKDLTNSLNLCKMAGNPQDKIKCIHIAGTNGKGTTSHIVAAGLQAQGYAVGVYTSPHYKDFRERIKINGQFIDLKYITNFLNKYRAEIEAIEPSFFELTVVLAFSWFADQHIDFAVIETGLGGRLDSTNVITPILSIITNISFDHQNMLGDTLDQIASEKADIIKPNVPVIIGETQKVIEQVFINKANQVNAPILFADQHLNAKIIEAHPYLSFQLHLDGTLWNKPLHTTLSGPFQYKNIITGLFALHFLSTHIAIDMDKVWEFMQDMSNKTKYSGRWQTLGLEPLIIADSAHNEGGLTIVTQQIAQIKAKHKHIVLGFVNDKTLDLILGLFPKNATYYWAKANVPRGLDAINLKAKAAEFGLHGNAYSSVRKAFAAAKIKAQKDDFIYIGGSIFVVAEVI